MKKLIIIAIMVIILSGFVSADDRTGIFPINSEQCTYEEIPENNETSNETIIIIQEVKQNNGGNHVWCAPKWKCTEWTECSEEGIQTRTCYDEYDCQVENNPPITEQGCAYTEKELEGFENEETKTRQIIIEETELLSEETNNQITGAVTGGGSGNFIWLIILIALISGMYIFVLKRKFYKSGTA